MSYTTWTTSGDIVDIIRRESEAHTKEEIAEILEKAGHLSGKGLPITVERVGYIMREYSIPSYQDHLKAKGYLTAEEKAATLNISSITLHKWKNAGLLDCEYIKTTGKGDYMFAP